MWVTVRRWTATLLVVALPCCVPGLPKAARPAETQGAADALDRQAAARELHTDAFQPVGTRYAPSFVALLSRSATPGDAAAKVTAARKTVSRLERATERMRGSFDDAAVASALSAVHDLETVAFVDGNPSEVVSEARDLLAYLYSLAARMGRGRPAGTSQSATRSELERALDAAGFAEALSIMADRGDDLARGAAARVLASEHPAYHAFDVLADARAAKGDHEGAKRARLAHLARNPQPSSFDLIAAARVCYFALDVARGDAMVARARPEAELDGPDAERALDEEVFRGAHAREYVRTRESRDYEGRLANARAALALSRGPEGQRNLLRLARERPSDGRLLTHLARARLMQGLDVDSLREASQLVDRARLSASRPPELDDLAIAVYATRLAAEQRMGTAEQPDVRALTDALSELVQEIARRDPAKGEPLALFIEATVTMARKTSDPPSRTEKLKRFHDLAVRSIGLARRYPSSYQASSLGRAFGVLAEDKEMALAALDLKIPRASTTRALETNLRALSVAVGTLWNAPSKIASDDEILEGVEETDDDAGEARLLTADAFAGRAFRSGAAVDPATWLAIANRYLDAVPKAPEDSRLRAAAGAIVALFQAGKSAEAHTLAEGLRGRGVDEPLVLVNLGAMQAEGDDLAGAQATFERVIAAARGDGATEEARRWLALVADRRHQADVAKEAARLALESPHDERTAPLPRSAGSHRVSVRLTTKGKMTARFFIAPHKERFGTLDVRVEMGIAWLLAAPITDQELARIAGTSAGHR